MEESKKDQNHGGHMCPHCSSGGRHDHTGGSWCGNWGSCGKHFLLRWVLGLFILFSVFWLGIKVGELKNILRSEFGYGNGYSNHSYIMRGYNGGYPMMNWKVTAPATDARYILISRNQ